MFCPVFKWIMKLFKIHDFVMLSIGKHQHSCEKMCPKVMEWMAAWLCVNDYRQESQKPHWKVWLNDIVLGIYDKRALFCKSAFLLAGSMFYQNLWVIELFSSLNMLRTIGKDMCNQKVKNIDYFMFFFNSIKNFLFMFAAFWFKA